MARKRLNKTQAVQREIEAFDLRAKGRSLRSIARELGLSHERVRQILATIDERELASLSEHYETLKVAQNSRLETIIEESFGSWFQSKEPLRRVRQTTNADGEEVTVNDLVEQTGNPSYLDRARHALADQRSLWGLDVAAAEQDEFFSIANVTRRMAEREQAYEQRLAEESAKPDDGSTPAIHESIPKRPMDDGSRGGGG